MARRKVGTGASTGADTGVTERVEIVTRGERRRSYTPEAGARVLEVAQRHGISPSLLHRWRREAEGRPPRKAARPAPRLVPLLVGPPAGASAPCGAATEGAAVEVVLRNGRVLRVGAAADAAMVARLAAVLEA